MREAQVGAARPRFPASEPILLGQRICQKGRLTLSSVALLLVLHADAPPPWAPGGPSRAEDLIISLATIGAGDDQVASMGGHAALAVVDTRLEHGRLYNFGVVDFSPDLMWNFVLGKLDFHADEAGILQTYDAYKALDRDVRVQVLNLTPEQALGLANALAVGVLPQNRTYRYHHFDDNCSTRPRDLIDRALGGALRRATSGPSRMSLRDHARRYTRVFPAVSVWLDYMQNAEIDRPITVYDEGFLPDELERQLDALTVDGRPVVKSKSVIYVSKNNAPPPSETPRWGGWLAFASLLAGAAVLALSRTSKAWPRRALGAWLATVGLAWGTSGLLLFLLATLTDRTITHRNENLLFINPLTLALLPLGVMLAKGHRRALPSLKWVTVALAATSLLGVGLKVLPSFDQQNWNVIALALPLNLAMALAFTLRSRSAA
jgi:hypothetical protein